MSPIDPNASRTNVRSYIEIGSVGPPREVIEIDGPNTNAEPARAANNPFAGPAPPPHYGRTYTIVEEFDASWCRCYVCGLRRIDAVTAVFPCGHGMCDDCLEGWAAASASAGSPGTISCHVCRASTKLSVVRRVEFRAALVMGERLAVERAKRKKAVLQDKNRELRNMLAESRAEKEQLMAEIKEMETVRETLAVGHSFEAIRL